MPADERGIDKGGEGRIEANVVFNLFTNVLEYVPYVKEGLRRNKKKAFGYLLR